MAKTKKELGLCQVNGCQTKVSGHHAKCDAHRKRKVSTKDFAQRQLERSREKKQPEPTKRGA